MNKFIAQKGTIDEFPIAYTLEGNLDSKNLVIMLHGGGMDHHELGVYPGMKDGKNEKIIKNGQEKTKLYPSHLGNYDRLAGELIARDLDTMIVRVDLRNHGESTKENNEMDKRDTLLSRYTRDISDLIDYLVDKYHLENVNLVGTCFGGLVSQCYTLEIGKNEVSPMKHHDKLKSLTLHCPLSFLNLYTDNKEDEFNYKKTLMIKNGPEGFQFDKMKGLFEGKETLEEAKRIGSIAKDLGKTGIPILYMYGANDRLIPLFVPKQIIKDIQSVNGNIKVKEINSLDHGMSDHCSWDPQSSDIFLTTSINFLEEQLKTLENKR